MSKKRFDTIKNCFFVLFLGGYMTAPNKQSLYKLFHYDIESYKKEYERRFNDENTIHLDISVGGNPAFVCQTVDMYKTILSIEKTDKKVNFLCSNLPKIALEQFAQRCLIDEIVLTNNIEGIHSTRKEIKQVLSNLSKEDKHRRFSGLIKKYIILMKEDNVDIDNCQSIRSIYNDIFYEEIKDSDPDNLPDGEYFRKNPVSVYSATGKEIHRGLSPEKEIIEVMEKALSFLKDDNINMLLRISVFHYLFGYIHPFYNGNGRTSRFISSSLLSKELNYLIGYRISYTIKENISEYYKSFDICNSNKNRGDLTPFVEMFLNIIDISEKQLCEALEKRNNMLRHYRSLIETLPDSEDNDIFDLYNYLIQAALFANDGISTGELMNYLEMSYNTLRKKLKIIPSELLIKSKQGNNCFYRLDLDKIDEQIIKK